MSSEVEKLDKINQLYTDDRMKKTNTSQVSPLAGLFLGILAVSTASLFIRFAQGEAPSLVIAAGRMTGATLLLAPFALKGTIRDLRTIKTRTMLLIALAGLFLGLHFATWITSLEYTSIASSVVLVTTAPLWVALLSPVLLKEKVSPIVFIGLAVSLTGSVIVGLNSACSIKAGGFDCIAFSSMFTGRAFWGNLLALAGAFLSAGYLMVGRRVRNGISLTTYTFLVYGIAALSLIVMIILTGTQIAAYSGNTWIWMVLLAVVPQLIGHSTFNYFLKELSAAFVSIALLGEPVGTVILAYLFLHESPSFLEVVGGLLILTGIAIATVSNGRRKEITV